jgi:hypothetical protein
VLVRDVGGQVQIDDEDEIGAGWNLGRTPAPSEGERRREEDTTLLAGTHANQSALEAADRLRAADDDLGRQVPVVRVVDYQASGQAGHVVNPNGHSRCGGVTCSGGEYVDTRCGVGGGFRGASLAEEPRVVAAGDPDGSFASRDLRGDGAGAVRREEPLREGTCTASSGGASHDYPDGVSPKRG